MFNNEAYPHASQADNDDLQQVYRLLACPASSRDASSLDARVSGGCGLAQVAAHYGRRDLLKELLDAGCNVQLADNDGDTALTEAAACGHADVVELLLRSSVDADRPNRSGCTALHSACQSKHLKAARLLLNLGSARPGRLDAAGNSALHALAARSIEVVPPADACLSGQQMPNGFASNPDGSRQSIMLHRPQVRPEEIAELMHDMMQIDPSLSLDQVNRSGYTPLMKCVATGHWTLLPHLLSASESTSASLPPGCRNFDGFNLAHVFYAHHNCSNSSRAARGLLVRCLGAQLWGKLCSERVARGPYAGYSCVHFTCEFGQLTWLPKDLRLTGERTNLGESAVDILARRRQLIGLRQRCGSAETTAVWRQALLLLDPPLGWPRPPPDEASRARARSLLGPLCAASDEHDSGPLFRSTEDDNGSASIDSNDCYVSGRRYWQTGGRENRQYPLSLRLLVAAIGEDSPEAFASLLELGQLDGAWSSEFCRYLVGYLTTGDNTSALPYIGNGLAQLTPKHLDGFDFLDPLDLAVTLGRSRIVEKMLLARPFDLVPSCLRVLLMCNRMRQVRHRCVSDMRQCAQTVLVNALNSLHDGATSEKERQRVDAYVYGEIKQTGPTFLAIELPVLREGQQCEKIASPGRRYTILQLLLAAGCDEALSTRCIRMLVKRRWSSSIRSCLVCCRRQSCVTGAGQLSPAGKFVLHAMSMAVFTILLTAFLLTGNSGDSVWQLTGIGLLLAFVVDHLVLGCVLIRRTEHWCPDLPGAWRGTELLLPACLQLLSLVGLAVVGVTSLGGNRSAEYEYYLRLLLAVSYLLLSICWLYNLTVFRRIGPTVSILKTLILDDLLPFLSIFMLVTVAFGVFFHSVLSPGGNLYRVSDGRAERMSPIESLVETYSRPMLLAFGEFQIDSLRPCEKRSESSNCSDLAGTDCLCPHQDGLRLYLGLFVHIYLFVNLALLNLLIAKFSLTVNTKVEQAFVIWNRMRMRMLCEYSIMPTLPPPFSGLSLLYLKMRTAGCCTTLCSQCGISKPAQRRSDTANSMTNHRGAVMSWSQWDSFANCKPYLKYLWQQAVRFRNRRMLFLRKVKFEADGSVKYIQQA